MAPAIAILGMHRSGTSALSNVLGRLGAHLGTPERVSDGSEYIPIRDINAEIVNALGGHWSAPVGFEPGWTRRADIVALRDRAAQVLEEFRLANVWAWKDPRTSFTLPFWREILDADPIALISYRHPIEVAASLTKRNGFGIAHGLAMWERYNRSLLVSAAGLRTVVVAYDDLARDPVATLASVHRQFSAFGVRLEGTPESAADGVDAARRHHVADAIPDDVILAPQRALWDALRSLETPSNEFTTPILCPQHPASSELLEQRAATIRTERANAVLSQQLRSRRASLRRVLNKP